MIMRNNNRGARADADAQVLWSQIELVVNSSMQVSRMGDKEQSKPLLASFSAMSIAGVVELSVDACVSCSVDYAPTT